MHISDDRPPLWVTVLCTALAAVLGLSAGGAGARRDMQVEAVKHNAARWEVDTNGHTKFMWNTPPNIEL